MNGNYRKIVCMERMRWNIQRNLPTRSLWQTLDLTLRTFRGRWIGARTRDPVPPGSSHKTNLKLFPTENCSRSSRLRKMKLPLHSWRPLVHITHIKWTSSSRSKIQYICSLPLSKQAIDWDFHFRSETANKACNELGSQKNYKTLISTEVIIFVIYHWKGLSHFKMKLKLL